MAVPMGNFLADQKPAKSRRESADVRIDTHLRIAA
jgi:hypothetical protein